VATRRARSEKTAPRETPVPCRSPSSSSGYNSRELVERVDDLAPFHRLVAASPNDDANALARLALQFQP